MPKGVVFTDKEMLPFFEKMQRELGFKVLYDEITISLIKSNLFPLPLIKQKGKDGVEVCLSSESPQFPFLKVYVWPSYVAKKKRTRNRDSGWVLIKDERFLKEVALFCFPRRRTKNFLPRLYNDAFACRELVTHWAHPCPFCGALPKLELVKGGGKLHEVHFACSENPKHVLLDDHVCQKIKNPNVRKLLVGDIERFHLYQVKNFNDFIYHTPRRVLRAEEKAKKEAAYWESQNQKPKPKDGIVWQDFNVYNDNDPPFFSDE